MQMVRTRTLDALELLWAFEEQNIGTFTLEGCQEIVNYYGEIPNDREIDIQEIAVIWDEFTEDAFVSVIEPELGFDGTAYELSNGNYIIRWNWW